MSHNQLTRVKHNTLHHHLFLWSSWDLLYILWFHQNLFNTNFCGFRYSVDPQNYVFILYWQDHWPQINVTLKLWLLLYQWRLIPININETTVYYYNKPPIYQTGGSCSFPTKSLAWKMNLHCYMCPSATHNSKSEVLTSNWWHFGKSEWSQQFKNHQINNLQIDSLLLYHIEEVYT